MMLAILAAAENLEAPGSVSLGNAALAQVQASAIAGKTARKSAQVAKTAAAKPLAAKAANPRKAAPKSRSRKVAKPALLAGGNPQIAKGYGDAPVQAYIAAMPGWKQGVGRRLDALIVRMQNHFQRAYVRPEARLPQRRGAKAASR